MALDSKGFQDFKEIMERKWEEDQRKIASLEEEVLKVTSEYKEFKKRSRKSSQLQYKKEKELREAITKESVEVRQENQLMREQTEHLMRLLHEKDKDHEHLINVIHEKDKEIASLHDSLGYARNKINNAVITLGEIE
tara:strand:+ start:651 stop:1061 length:411 start_codon:yes stop_codon:yes gene_type:complete